MVRLVKLSLTVSLLLLTQSAAYAQEKAVSPQLATSEAVTLRQKLEAQKSQLDRLKQDLQRQLELIERQQRQLDAMQNQPKQPGPSAVSTAPSKAPAEKKPAQSAENGYGKVKFNGLLQGWYSGGNGGYRDTFRLRRSELKFSSEITPQVKWTVMLDLAKAFSVNQTFTTINGEKVVGSVSVNQASRILQDAFITLGYNKRANFNMGQMKVPISLENLQPSSAIETVERALFMTDLARGGLGDGRDLGVTVYGPLNKSVDYQIGLFNGTGENQNYVDRNDQKAVAGRLVVRPPFVRGLQVGGSGIWSGNGSRIDRPRRDRFGGELLFVREAFRFKSELMAVSDSDVHRLGYYAHAGYKVAPKVETVFRFDAYDPDRGFETNSSNVTERDYIMGFNYFIIESSLKLQANYLRKTFAGGIVPSRNLFLVNLQTWW